MNETKEIIIKEEKKDLYTGYLPEPYESFKDYVDFSRVSDFLNYLDKLDIDILSIDVVIDNSFLKSTFLSTNIVNVEKLQFPSFKKTIPFYSGNPLQDKAGECEISKMLEHNQPKQMQEYEKYFERELKADLDKFMTGQKRYSWRKLREEAQQKYNLPIDEIPNEGDLRKYYKFVFKELNERLKKIQSSFSKLENLPNIRQVI